MKKYKLIKENMSKHNNLNKKINNHYKDIKLGTGETITTITGRETTSFPKIDTSTNRKTQNSLNREYKWLIENVIAEAKARNNEFNLINFQDLVPKQLTIADIEGINDYLFSPKNIT